MKSNKRLVSYASIAVVGLAPNEMIAIETISVSRESCDLSGAWLIKKTDTAVLDDLINGKLIVFLNKESQSISIFEKFHENFIGVDDIFQDAKNEIEIAMKLFDQYVQKNRKEYAEYMNVPPMERKLLPKVVKKNLVAPEFSRWPESVKLDSAEKELTIMRKMSAVEGTPSEMRKVLAAARLIQLLIYMWKADEVERVNRVYVLDQDAENTILPPSWLSKIPVGAI